MHAKQALKPTDPRNIITRLPSGTFQAAAFYVNCIGCGGQMAHGRLSVALDQGGQGFRCEECAAGRQAFLDALRAALDVANILTTRAICA